MDYNCIEITNADLQRMRGSSPKDLHAKFLKEHEKVVLDAKEAKHKAKKRREIIERANSLLLLPHMTRALSKRLMDNTLNVTEKAYQREAISEKLAQILLAKKVDTEKKLELGQKERQENDEMKEHLSRERQRKDWEQCDKSRQLQISLKHQKELEEAEIEKYEAERSWQRAWQCKLDMDNAEREKLLKNKEFSRHYIMKMEDDNNKHNQEIQDEKDEEREALQRVKDEDLNEISLDNIKL